MSKKLDAFRIPREKGVDLRIKLSPEEKEEIIRLYPVGRSTRKLAAQFNVSRRLIQRLINPEADARLKEQRKINGKLNGHYNTKEQHRVRMNKHRHHKRELLNAGSLEKQKDRRSLCGV